MPFCYQCGYKFTEGIEKFCYQCGYKFTEGIEKFCPQCGFNLQNTYTSGKINSEISNTKGDVFGVGNTGSGTITSKEIGYTVMGNVIHLNVTGNLSRDIVQNLVIFENNK